MLDWLTDPYHIGYWEWVVLVLGIMGAVVIGIAAFIVALFKGSERRDRER
jgi:hypothetical protein